jgi:hypothetical protein
MQLLPIVNRRRGERKRINRDEVVIIRFDRCRLRNSKMVEKRHRQKEEADLAEREYTAFSLILIQQEIRKRSSFRLRRGMAWHVYSTCSDICRILLFYSFFEFIYYF